MTAEAQSSELLLRGVSPSASSYVGPALFSVLVHGALLGALLFASMLRPPPLLASQTIHVTLARLGTPRSPKLLPTRDAEPPPSVSPPVAVAEKLPPAPTVKPVPKPPPKLTAEKAKTPEENLRETMARLQKETTYERPGQRDGFAFGNADHTEGDLYWARVVDRVKRFYTVANTIPMAERARLVATVEVAIDRDGTILEIHTIKGSGNATFDRAIESAVRRCQSFPAPPPELAKDARRGITLEFHAAEM